LHSHVTLRTDFSLYLDPLEGVMASLSAEQDAALNLLREQELAVQNFLQGPGASGTNVPYYLHGILAFSACSHVI
jgi:hypothetical protein